MARSSFNTLNEEHGTYGGGWGEIDESNLSIQLQHCNYTVVVHTGVFLFKFVQCDHYAQYAEWDLNKTSNTFTGTLTGLFLLAYRLNIKIA